MEKMIFKVPGISCQHCVHTIKRELNALKGVEEVDVDLDSKKVSVEFDNTVTTDDIESLLAKINYPVEKR